AAFFFFSSRRRHTRFSRDWSSDVCSSDLLRAKYFISGEINTRVSDAATVERRLAELAERYRDGHTYWMDGFSAEFPDWHFNVRASNTEPLLRLNLEATSPELMAEKRDEVLAVIRQS